METGSSESSASAAGASAAVATPTSPKEKKYYIDSTFITPPREGVDMVSPLKDGLGEGGEREGRGGRETFIFTSVNDWDLYQKLLDHLFSRHVKTTPDLHPILMSEAPVRQTFKSKTVATSCPFLISVEQQTQEKETDRADV